MRGGARAAGGVAALLLGLTCARRASALDASRAPDTPRVVDLTVRGEEPGALEDTLRELMARLRVSVSARPEGAAPNGDDVLAHIQVDLSSPSEAVIVVVDGRSGRVILRRSVARASASASIVREELAHAAQSAVESELLADADRPPPAPPPAPPPVASLVTPAPPPAAEAPSPRVARAPSLALDVATLVGGGPFANGVGPVVRVGGGVVLSSRRGLRPSLSVTAEYAPPFESNPSTVVSRTSLFSVRAIPALEVVRSSWMAVDLGAGGGFDVLAVSPRSPVLPASSLAASTTRTDPVLSAVVAAHFPLVPSVVLSLLVGADADLATRTYVLHEGSAETGVLAPWRVRPTVLAGFTFTALGEGRFASHEVAP